MTTIKQRYSIETDPEGGVCLIDARDERSQWCETEAEAREEIARYWKGDRLEALREQVQAAIDDIAEPCDMPVEHIDAWITRLERALVTLM